MSKSPKRRKAANKNEEFFSGAKTLGRNSVPAFEFAPIQALHDAARRFASSLACRSHFHLLMLKLGVVAGHLDRPASSNLREVSKWFLPLDNFIPARWLETGGPWLAGASCGRRFLRGSVTGA